MIIEVAFLLEIGCISRSFSFPPSMEKLAFIDFTGFNLSAMEMFNSIHELSNVFDGIRFHDSVAMNLIIFPFTNILNSIFIFLLIDL